MNIEGHSPNQFSGDTAWLFLETGLQRAYHCHHPGHEACKAPSGFTAPVSPAAAAAAAAKSLQSCPTLCNPIDGSPGGSPVPGILQARTLEWVAISFSSAWKWKVKVKSLSRVRPSATTWTAAFQAPPWEPPWDFPGKSTGVGCHCLLCLLALQPSKLNMNTSWQPRASREDSLSWLLGSVATNSKST